jgi:siroheme synthase-like protein
MSFDYMPISVSLNGKECLIVGGGTIALRQLENLSEYDTRITLVAPEIHPQIEHLAQKNGMKLEKREYRAPEAGAYNLVIAATNDPTLNETVYEDARGSGALVNVVDDPAHCDFIFPAVLRRDCMTTAISTDGKAPFMSGQVRALLEDLFPKHWARLMRMAARFRTMVRERWGDDSVVKQACYTRFLAADWTTMFAELNNADIDVEMKKLLEPANDANE